MMSIAADGSLLDGLDGVPVADHVAVFEAIDADLRARLAGDRDDDPVGAA
jgi:hypothetical protein